MKKKLITSALPYVNNVPHLGNIIGSVLSADVYARFCRSFGYETLYICATDEYGTATETKAREQNQQPQEICDHYHHIHKAIYHKFRIAFDHFGRTSIPEHTEITQSVYHDLEEAGCITEEESEQLYCLRDHMFLADRFVEGYCPHCGYEDARGDQCDKCGKLLQPSDLKNPRCKVCGDSPTWRRTRHLYLDLERLRPQLEQFFKHSSQAGKWSKNAVAWTKSWLEKPLQPRPITRDLKWGVPVPKAGYENKVFYVWFDAVMGYISNTAAALGADWRRWWHSPQETELYQFMAKDNIPFHTIIFPAALLGTGKAWTTLTHINSTEYLNYEGEKFSKSRGIGVFGDDLEPLGIDIDLWRFYLLFHRPESADTNFGWHSFYETVNNAFIDNIGNLLNRLSTFAQKNFASVLPAPADLSAAQQGFITSIISGKKEVIEQFEAVALRDALHKILALAKRGNQFFQQEQPWKTVKEDQDRVLATLAILAWLLRDLAALLEPYMPITAERICAILQVEPRSIQQIDLEGVIPAFHLGTPQILFPKLDPKQAEQMRQKFGGVPEQNRQSDQSTPSEQCKKVPLFKSGLVQEVQQHPNADKLYVLQVDCAEEQPRTIVTGLVAYHSAEELHGKMVIVAANLKAAKLRGIRSEGMVLAAEEGERVHIFTLPATTPSGQVLALAAEGEQIGQNAAAEQAKTISIDDFFATPLNTTDGVLMLDGQPLLRDGQEIAAPPGFENCTVR